MIEQVRLCDVWPMENWLGSSLNQIQGWTTAPESYSRVLEQGPLMRMRTHHPRALDSHGLSNPSFISLSLFCLSEVELFSFMSKWVLPSLSFSLCPPPTGQKAFLLDHCCPLPMSKRLYRMPDFEMVHKHNVVWSPCNIPPN